MFPFLCYFTHLFLHIASVQFSSVQLLSHVRLCVPMNHSMPGLPVYHQLLEFTQTHAHRVGDAIQPSHPVVPFSSCPQSLPASGSFPMSQLFAWGGQSIGVSALASVLPMNTQTQDWLPLGWTGWISLHIAYFSIKVYYIAYKGKLSCSVMSNSLRPCGV